MLNFIYIYFISWLRIVKFWGRSSRFEFLVFNLVSWVLIAVAGYLYSRINVVDIGFWLAQEHWRTFLSWNVIKNVFYYGVNYGGPLVLAWIIFGAAFTLAVFSLSIRRLHDINRSGAYAFLLAIPIIGWIPLFILCILKGDPSNNRYGKPPEL